MLFCDAVNTQKVLHRLARCLTQRTLNFQLIDTVDNSVQMKAREMKPVTKTLIIQVFSWLFYTQAYKTHYLGSHAFFS